MQSYARCSEISVRIMWGIYDMHSKQRRINVTMILMKFFTNFDTQILMDYGTQWKAFVFLVQNVTFNRILRKGPKTLFAVAVWLRSLVYVHTGSSGMKITSYNF